MQSNQPIPVNTIITEVPQLQTVMQDGLSPITTVVNAPWVSVTSVNGKTGDVNIVAQVADYQPGASYQRGDIVIYESSLYWAASDFVAGPFNPDQWESFQDVAQIQSDWDVTDTTSASYIKNKPTKLSQFENDTTFVTKQEQEDALAPINTSLETISGTTIPKLEEEVDGKVTKENGLGLSENSFTTAEKTKLSSLADIYGIGSGLSLENNILSIPPAPSVTDKIYSASVVTNQGLGVNDETLVPEVGQHIFVRATSSLSNTSYSRLSVNGGEYLPIQSPPIASVGTPSGVVISQDTIVELIYLGTSWQCLNIHPQIKAGDLSANCVGSRQIDWDDLKSKFFYWSNDVTKSCSAWTQTTLASTTTTGLEPYSHYYYLAVVRWLDVPGDADIQVEVNGAGAGQFSQYTSIGGLKGVTNIGEFDTTSSTVTIKKQYNGTAGSVRFGPVCMLFLRASY